MAFFLHFDVRAPREKPGWVLSCRLLSEVHLPSSINNIFRPLGQKPVPTNQHTLFSPGSHRCFNRHSTALCPVSSHALLFVPVSFLGPPEQPVPVVTPGQMGRALRCSTAMGNNLLLPSVLVTNAVATNAFSLVKTEVFLLSVSRNSRLGYSGRLLKGLKRGNETARLKPIGPCPDHHQQQAKACHSHTSTVSGISEPC